MPEQPLSSKSASASLPFWRSIVGKQTLFISCVVILTAVPLTLVSFYSARQVLRDQIRNRLSVVANYCGVVIDTYVDQQEERIALVTSRTRLRNLIQARLAEPPADPTQFIRESSRILRDARRSTGGFSEIWVTDTAGRVITATNIDDIGVDFSGEPEFRLGLDETSIGIPRYNAVDKRWSAFLTAPATTNESQFLGVVIVRLDVTPLRDLLSDQTGLGATGAVYVATEHEGRFRYLFRREESLIEDPSAQQLMSLAMSLALKSTTGFTRHPFGNHEVLAAYRQVAYQPVEHRKWVMVAAMDVEEAYAPVAWLQRLVLTLIAGLLVGGTAAAYAVARRHTMPIVDLAASANRVANGELEARVSMDRQDELGILGEAFNEMTQQLEESYRNLEQKVADRTRELRAARDAEHQANLAKGEFLANISHEVRTPMNAIIGMAELVLRTELNATQHEYLSIIGESAETLLSIINQILDFSKIEAGKLELESVDFELREEIGSMMKSLGLRAHAKSLELAWHVDSDVPKWVRGDPVRLKQLLVNLVNNGIKFTSEGEIVLDVEFDRDDEAQAQLEDGAVAIHFRVRDTGIGIPLEKQQRIFAAFEQADMSTTREYGGTGLGLAISREIVEAMGGRIWLESKPDHGSIFHFTAVFEKAQAKPAWHLPTDLQERPALIVDDNQTNRKILTEMLADWGMEVTTADSGKAALDNITKILADDRKYPLVISDVNMPLMDGFQLTTRLREFASSEDLIVILLTSGGQPSDIDKCTTLGVSAHLIKPVKPSELQAAILAAFDDAEYATQTKVEGHAPMGRALRILLVEDGKANQLVANALLSEWGHTVSIAENGQEAVSKWKDGIFDLILMDVQMPIMDGMAATREIRAIENGHRTPIVAMTAHAMKGDEQRCLDAGMDAYITKPIRHGELRRALSQVVIAPANEGPEKTNEGPEKTNEGPEKINEGPEKTNEGPEKTNEGSEKAGGSDKSRERADEPPHTEVSDNHPVIRWDEALKRVGGVESRLEQLVKTALNEIPSLFSALEVALAKDDIVTAQRLAHTMRGAALILCAVPLEQAAGEVELTEQWPIDLQHPLVETLRNEAERFFAECRRRE